MLTVIRQTFFNITYYHFFILVHDEEKRTITWRSNMNRFFTNVSLNSEMLTEMIKTNHGPGCPCNCLANGRHTFIFTFQTPAHVRERSR